MTVLSYDLAIAIFGIGGKLDYELRSPFDLIAKYSDHIERRPLSDALEKQTIAIYTLSGIQTIFAELGCDL